MRPTRPSDPSVTTGECIRDWPATLRCGKGLTPQEDAPAHNSLATDACQPKTADARGVGRRPEEHVMDWLTSVEKELMSPPVPPPRSITGSSQRSYSSYSNPSVSDDRDRGALTGVSAMCGRSGRSVVTKIGPDLIRRLQDGYLEMSFSALGPEGMRAFAAKLRDHPQHLYCLKLKLTNVKTTGCKTRKKGRHGEAEQQARKVVAESLAVGDVTKVVGDSLVHLLQVSTQLQLLEMSLSPGMALAQRLCEGLLLNSTLRCVSFSHSAMGDAMFATVAAGLQHAAALEVLLLCDCHLTDECFLWVNALIKVQGTQRTDVEWQSTLRTIEAPCRATTPLLHSSTSVRDCPPPPSGLIKLDLSHNRKLTVDGVRTLAVTLRRMNNRVAYVGLRRNRLDVGTTSLMRELLSDSQHLRVVDLRGNDEAGDLVLRDGATGPPLMRVPGVLRRGVSSNCGSRSPSPSKVRFRSEVASDTSRVSTPQPFPTAAPAPHGRLRGNKLSLSLSCKAARASRRELGATATLHKRIHAPHAMEEALVVSPRRAASMADHRDALRQRLATEATTREHNPHWSDDLTTSMGTDVVVRDRATGAPQIAPGDGLLQSQLTAQALHLARTAHDQQQQLDKQVDGQPVSDIARQLEEKYALW